MATDAAVEVVYPSSDGQPMAETGIHVRAIQLLQQALEDFFRDRPDVFVAADMFWYWEEGNVASRVAPDVMVVPGVGNHDRRSFFSWEEGGAVPAVVFEMASQNTWREDEEGKHRLYEELGVREYVLFDPEWAYLSSQVKAYRLNGTAYRRLRPSAGEEIETGLGFRLRAEGTMLRLIDATSGQPIPTRQERADAEKQRADAEKQRADAEKQRADAMAAEVERLKALLRQNNVPNGNDS